MDARKRLRSVNSGFMFMAAHLLLNNIYSSYSAPWNAPPDGRSTDSSIAKHIAPLTDCNRVPLWRSRSALTGATMPLRAEGVGLLRRGGCSSQPHGTRLDRFHRNRCANEGASRAGYRGSLSGLFTDQFRTSKLPSAQRTLCPGACWRTNSLATFCMISSCRPAAQGIAVSHLSFLGKVTPTIASPTRISQ